MCFKSCSRVCHWGPLAALAIIKWVSLATVYSNTMWWPPESGLGGMVNMISFLMLSSLTTFHFFSAMCEGPGYLPLKWSPEIPGHQEYLQFCTSCNGFKAPRAHHCRKCQRCVLKMDHHCPWINNCVGHFNHGHFVLFLLFAFVGCAQATVTLSFTLYYGLHRSWYLYYGSKSDPLVTLNVWSLLAVMFALGLAIGVVVSVGALLYFQLRAIWRNQTGIEDWILTKAEYRRRVREDTDPFQHPYNLGYWRNIRQVLTWNYLPAGDGVDWPIREGSDKYDLTIEQLKQKADKRQRTVEYKVMKPYSGSWFPIWSYGVKVACHPPCTDEARIGLCKGDTVCVTRWKSHWLYGEKLIPVEQDSASLGGAPRIRGWFPRRCAVELVDDTNKKDD